MRISEQAVATVERPPATDTVCSACGQNKPSRRNRQRHNLFFAMLQPALEQWPEAHGFQPMSTEHLRAWLLWQSGWCTTRDLDIGGPQKAMAVQAVRFFLTSKDHHRFFSSTAKGIREYTPRSIAWNKCRESEFAVIMDSSSNLIASIIGVPIEQLKREKAA